MRPHRRIAKNSPCFFMQFTLKKSKKCTKYSKKAKNVYLREIFSKKCGETESVFD